MDKRLARVGEQAGPWLLLAPLPFGVAQLIDSLRDPDRPLVWLELTPDLTGDTTELGNALAEAVERGLSARLLPYGLPAGYGLAVLQNALPYAAPLTLALSGADPAPELARSFLRLHGPDCRVVLHFEALPEGFTVPEDALVLTADDLKLTPDEALELVAGRLPEAETLELLERTDGAIDHFLSELNRRLEQPPHLLPGPQGPRTLPGYEPQTDAEGLLALLTRKRRWLEALELAAHRLPERVPEVLAEAGHAYHERGLHRRLWTLLEPLPGALKEAEVVRYWRLECAFRLGRQEELRRETWDYLKDHEAPALRALAAGVFAPTNREEAKRAFEAEPTPFTAFVFGRLSTGGEAVALLRHAVALAEQGGRGYEVVRSAGELASKLIFQGDFAGSVHWGAWALREYERLGVRDGLRRLYIVNNWAYARLLTGDLAGLELLLKEYEAQLEGVEPNLAYLFRSTLGDFLLASARPSEALVYYRRNHEQAPRWRLGSATLSMVKTLLELGEVDEALSIAAGSLPPNESVRESQSLPAILAHGLALSFTDPEAALPALERALSGFRNAEYSAHRIAQASLYLALARQKLGQTDELEELLFDPKSHLTSLAPPGLRLLSGPESALRPIWGKLLEQTTPLELRFLGGAEVWLEGRRLELYPQWLEILAALVIRGRPLTLEELLSDLFGDGGNRVTLKASLSRLRRHLPISTHPYRLEVAHHADFEEVLALLKRNEVRLALERYRGPLLPSSQAPLVRETDAFLGEALRRAALERRDPDALLKLFEHFPGDLELLEAAHAALESGDPRRPLVRAQVELVRSDWLN